MGLHQTQSFCTGKETVTGVKIQPTEPKKFFASYTFNEVLISRIYREFKELSLQRINIAIKK
jgi:hypothetical protein